MPFSVRLMSVDAWIIIDEGGVLRMLDDDEVNEMIGIRRGLPEEAIDNYTVCYTFTGAQLLEDEAGDVETHPQNLTSSFC